MHRSRLRTGIFMAPFHPVHEDPTQALRRDLDLVSWLDELGYDEAWFGEHHSAGYEIISSPELMIAAAAERTSRIRLGTGVISLPYHNPLMVADRMIQLDHMTMGRAMFGVGPGLLASDAFMLGIHPSKQRDRMAEALDVILRLMNGETVTEKTEWYELDGARCQLLPFTRPRPEMAVASTVTPSGGKLAGKYGLGMLCVAATSLNGYDALGINWKIACDVAAGLGREMPRSGLRLVAPMHLAPTREQARREVEYGLGDWLDYFVSINPAMSSSELTADDPITAMNESGFAVIGTPEDAVAQLERLERQSGGFGTFLALAHNWADFDATRRSYELLLRHALPRFEKANRARAASFEYAVTNADRLMGAAMQAAAETIERHMREEAEQAAEAPQAGAEHGGDRAR
jgi:limonene 1,2-monooxygenase